MTTPKKLSNTRLSSIELAENLRVLDVESKVFLTKKEGCLQHPCGFDTLHSY